MIYCIKKLKLSDEKHQQLLSEARLLKQKSNIRFKIVSVSKAGVQIETTQGCNISENYASDIALAEYTKNLFKDYVDGRAISIETHTYEVLPTMEVRFKNRIPDNYRTKRINNDDEMEE